MRPLCDDLPDSLDSAVPGIGNTTSYPRQWRDSTCPEARNGSKLSTGDDIALRDSWFNDPAVTLSG